MSILRAIVDWRPRPAFYYGWLVLGMASLAAFAATGVSQIVLGGIQSLIFEDMGWDRSTIAFAVTAGTWASGFATPFIGRLADRHGPRGLMPVAALMAGLCFFAISGIQSVWQFYVAYIIARAVANPNLIGVVPRTAAVNFFHRKRNLALGLTSMARPIGGAINIQLISLIASVSSWRVAYRFLGGFALLLVAPLFLIMRRRPEDIGLRPDGDKGPISGESSRLTRIPTHAEVPQRAREFSWTAGEAALTSAFWLIVMAESVTILTAGSLSFQIVPYLENSGLSLTVAAGALSLSSLLGAVVNPGWGFLADRFSPRRLVLILMPSTAVVTVFFLITTGAVPSFFIVVVWGAVSGGLNVLSGMILAQYYGRGSFGSITGLVGPFQTGALGLGPTFGAVLFNSTGGYASLFWYGIASYVLATLLIYLARPPALPSRALAEGFTADD